MLPNSPNASFRRHIPLVPTSEEGRKTLFVPFLGQSNGEFMSWIYEPYQPGATSNEDSGAIVLDRELTDPVR